MRNLSAVEEQNKGREKAGHEDRVTQATGIIYKT